MFPNIQLIVGFSVHAGPERQPAQRGTSWYTGEQSQFRATEIAEQISNGSEGAKVYWI